MNAVTLLPSISCLGMVGPVRNRQIRFSAGQGDHPASGRAAGPDHLIRPEVDQKTEASTQNM